MNRLWSPLSFAMKLTLTLRQLSLCRRQQQRVRTCLNVRPRSSNMDIDPMTGQALHGGPRHTPPEPHTGLTQQVHQQCMRPRSSAEVTEGRTC
jgi:hypothetical protein